MREIKFRAWDVFKLEQVAVLNMGGLVSFVGSANSFFIPKDIMQYTGLKDANGVEIYECDVIHVSDWCEDGDNGNAVIEWSILDAAFLATETTGIGSTCMSNIFDSGKFEVIGNIYEHKHLLDGAE